VGKLRRAWRYDVRCCLDTIPRNGSACIAYVEPWKASAARFLYYSPNAAVKTKKMISSKKIAVAIAVCCFLLFLSEAAPQQQEWLFYPVVTRLQGKLTKVTKYGKPTYGENPEKDEKVEVPILILQTPVRAKAQTTSSVNNESLTNVSFIQLIFPAEVGDYSKHLGMVIVVEGTLERGLKGDHFTDLVMTVKVLNPTAKQVY
jgi:hypothetical protein